MFQQVMHDSIGLLPEMWLVVLGLVLLMVEAFYEGDQNWLMWLALGGMITAGLLIIPASQVEGAIFSNMLSADAFTNFFRVMFVIIGSLILVISYNFTNKLEINTGEYYVLVVFATLGMMIMGAATDFVSIYLGLELTSLCSYVLCGFVTKDKKSNESALKYFLLGLLASAIMIFGVSYIYGMTGSTNIHEVSKALSSGKGAWNPLLLTGMVMMIIGFAFKIAAAPFHAYAPDVYEGAPTPVTAFISIGPKVAAIAAMIRIFGIALEPMKTEWAMILAVLAVLSMFIGNLLALRQDKLKRMLAFSGVVHVGYALIGFVAASVSQKMGYSSVLLYFLVYFIPNIGVFAIIILMSGKNMDCTFDDLKGLGSKHPWLALVMGIFMLSLMGMPPASGFIGKFRIFSASVESGVVWLGVVGVVNAIIASYYYLRAIVCMYAHDSEGEILINSNIPALAPVIVLMAVVTIYMGLFPNPFIELVQHSVGAIL